MMGSEFQKWRLLGLSGLLVSTLVLDSSALAQNYQYPQEQQESPAQQAYSQYYEQAIAAYQHNELTKAIDLMTKAYQLAPNNSAVVNNLSACYIKRGVYYHNTQKDYQKALEDYRKALFFLAYQWPLKEPKSPGVTENMKIIRSNMVSVLQSLQVPKDDWKWHLKSASELRRKGMLQDAMVEYGWVTDLNPQQAEAWVAQGDIYTVLQRPDNAVLAYQKAVDVSATPSADVLVKQGVAYVKAGNPEKATESLNRALAVNPGNKDALMTLEEVWQREIVLNPRNLSAHLNLGAAYQQLKRYDEAFAQYQVAERLSPNNPLIKFNLASMYQAQGSLDQAMAMYNALLAQNPGDFRAMLQKADILEQQGKTAEAEQTLQRALQASPDKKAVMEQLIATYKAEGKTEKLEGAWNFYAGNMPQDASVQYQAALAMHEAKNYEAAIRYYQKAIQLKPGMSEAYANMGTAYHAMGRDEDAVSALKQALALDPNLTEVKNLMASITQQKDSQLFSEAAQLHAAGKYAEAVKAYEAALKDNPKNGDLLANYGLALQALKRYNDAIAAYDKAIAISPTTASYVYYKATAYDEQDQIAAAQKFYEKALALDPKLTQAKEALKELQTSGNETQLAEALKAYEQKAYPKALALVDQILKADMNNATAYYYRGLVYDAQQKWEPARQAYESAVRLDPKNADAVYALAVVLDTQGKKPDAKRMYQQFIQLNKQQPDDDFIKYAKERVSAL